MSDQTVKLTERQKEIAKLVSSGWSADRVGLHLGISIHTVKVHLRQIYHRLGITKRSQLVEALGLIGIKTKPADFVPQPPVESLTDLEIAFIRSIRDGKSAREFAEDNKLTRTRARSICNSAYRKTGTFRQAQLVQWAEYHLPPRIQ